MHSLVTCCGVALALVTATARGDDRAGDPQRIDAGRGIYAAQCAACHGPRGEGQPDWDRPNAAGELPAPPHDREGHTWKHSDAMLYRLVKDGWRDPYNRTQRLTMPAFGQTLAPGEIHDVIEYLKTMWTSDQRIFQQEESQQEPFPPEAR